VLVGVLRSSVEAAQLAVAARVYTIALVIPEIVVTVLFPYLLHARREGVEDLQGQVTRLFLLVMVAGALVSTALLLAAPVAVRLTAGSAYSQAAVPARWLALLIAPAYLSSVATILLVEQRRVRAAAASLVLPAIAAYLVELALAGRFGETVCILCGGGAVLLSCIQELAAARRYGVLKLSWRVS
jgi:O-antigen/teichoic acid export membrane protein